MSSITHESSLSPSSLERLYPFTMQMKNLVNGLRMAIFSVSYNFNQLTFQKNKVNLMEFKALLKKMEKAKEMIEDCKKDIDQRKQSIHLLFPPEDKSLIFSDKLR